MNASLACQEDIVWQGARRPFKQALLFSNDAFPQAQRWSHKPYTHKATAVAPSPADICFLSSLHTHSSESSRPGLSLARTWGKEQVITFHKQELINSPQLPYTGEVSHRRVGRSYTCCLQLKAQRQSPTLISAGPAHMQGFLGRQSCHLLPCAALSAGFLLTVHSSKYDGCLWNKGRIFFLLNFGDFLVEGMRMYSIGFVLWAFPVISLTTFKKVRTSQVGQPISTQLHILFLKGLRVHSLDDSP